MEALETLGYRPRIKYRAPAAFNAPNTASMLLISI
jgi:hypothetical protein